MTLAMVGAWEWDAAATAIGCGWMMCAIVGWAWAEDEEEGAEEEGGEEERCEESAAWAVLGGRGWARRAQRCMAATTDSRTYTSM